MIVQRYPKYFWPILRGEEPLMLTGPLFKEIAADDCGCEPFWRMLPGFVTELRKACSMLDGDNSIDARRCVAELLLDIGAVNAVWVSHTPDANALPEPVLRRIMAIETLAREIPSGYHGSIADDTLELLDGMSSIQHYHSTFNAHDDVKFLCE